LLSSLQDNIIFISAVICCAVSCDVRFTVTNLLALFRRCRIVGRSYFLYISMVGVCDVFVEIKLLSQQNEQFNKSVQN